MSANPGLRSLPYFKRMHEMTVEHAHEEIHLLAIVSTMMFETMAVMPPWLDYYRAHDQTPLSFTTSAPSASIPASAARRCGFTSTASA